MAQPAINWKPRGLPDRPVVFFSYARRDDRKIDPSTSQETVFSRFAHKLHKEIIRETGLISLVKFFDKKSIGNGDYFKRTIIDKITNTIIFIPLVTRNFATSEFCTMEMGYFEKNVEKNTCKTQYLPQNQHLFFQ